MLQNVSGSRGDIRRSPGTEARESTENVHDFRGQWQGIRQKPEVGNT